MSHGAPWNVVVVGAGGFGREVAQYVRDTFADDECRLAGVVDDRPNPERLAALGLPFLGPITDHQPGPGERLVVAIGEPGVRMRVVRHLASRGAQFLTVVHPLAYVASSARIGDGCIVAPFASIGAGAVLGAQVQVHFYASAAHDTRIGEGAALSPYVAVNGGAVVEDGAFLGTRATVNPLKRVGAHAKVAAASVVYQDVPAGALAAGNPAKSRVLRWGAARAGS